ncbi:MAG: Cof-type HAD-IIB family hydrolase [Tissierellales bacterium]|jgi:Cof subfamily protein (haloacid dehalogenase superfamily)|nr:Cof-type HAD-IIB family hydrolase [Tissierellales bacterium]
MKLIAIDLDGTLLNHSTGTIDKENVLAIQELQNQGVEITIATGRAYFDALNICDKAGLHTHIISDNGASTHIKTGQRIAQTSIPQNIVSEVLSWLESENYYYEVFTNEAIFTPSYGRELLRSELVDFLVSHREVDESHYDHILKNQFGQHGFKFIDSYSEIIDERDDFLGILVFSFFEDKRKKGISALEHLKSDVSIISSLEQNFELANIKSSKGTALESLANYLNISMCDTAAIGDNYNDIPMFEKANYSIAMGNADEKVKSKCKVETLYNDHQGVAYALRRYNKKYFNKCL